MSLMATFLKTPILQILLNVEYLIKKIAGINGG